MFKKSRRKIVAAIMSILVVLWVGTLGVIYASSYWEMSERNQMMLKAHADRYVLTQSFDQIKPPARPFPGGSPDFDPDSPMFQLSTFYTVAISYNGEILETKNESPTVHSDTDLEQLAQQIVKDDQTDGTENNLVFLKTDKEGYTLVTFMDNTVLNEGATTLFRYTLICGGVALVLFFFLAVYLAKKIVNPLEKSYHTQKQFISDAGHELKTPVSVVSANAELLSREIGNNQWLQNIQYENERMGILVTRLLELARTENVAPPTGRVNLSRLVRGEALPFESVAFEKGLTLEHTIADQIEVEGNSDRLKQVVSILLDNAISHSQQGEWVTLSLTADHNMASLSVVNRGDEIPAEQQEKIFERFYRVDPARSDCDNHYGLGLAIAKAIVTSHKGHIDLRCYNGLVEFTVRLPMA